MALDRLTYVRLDYYQATPSQKGFKGSKAEGPEASGAHLDLNHAYVLYSVKHTDLVPLAPRTLCCFQTTPSQPDTVVIPSAVGDGTLPSTLPCP